MKYIDADRLRKEVKKNEKAAHKSALGCADSETRKFHEGKDFAYQYVGILIDSLQQEQSEKDHELTIKDLELLHTFLYAVKNNKQGAFTFTRLSDEQYNEVLRRFKGAKK